MKNEECRKTSAAAGVTVKPPRCQCRATSARWREDHPDSTSDTPPTAPPLHSGASLGHAAVPPCTTARPFQRSSRQHTYRTQQHARMGGIREPSSSIPGTLCHPSRAPRAPLEMSHVPHSLSPLSPWRHPSCGSCRPGPSTVLCLSTTSKPLVPLGSPRCSTNTHKICHGRMSRCIRACSVSVP